MLESEGNASSSEGGIVDALARAEPAGIDGALVHSRLMATLFDRKVPTPRFGRFELRERIGQGGMGVVYRAWDPQLERTVAIKLVDTAGLDPTLRERALREARSLAKLAHPNVITVFEAGLADDRVWIAMEYVPGTTMRDALARTPRPDTAVILRRWIAVGRGLVAVHEAGLIHRDVKPSNVLMGDDGRPRLIDFGLVRGPRQDDELSNTSELVETTNDSPDATRGFVGTHAYAAPEQRDAGRVGAAADQYSFCVSVRESLGDAPSRVQQALARGLAEDPGQRFPTLAELLDELEAAIDGPSRRLGLLLGAAALGAVVTGIVVGQLREPPEAPQPCAIDPSALDGTWDDERRETLRRRSSASELEFAATSFGTLERRLDEWSASWLDARESACAATRIEGVQSEAALDLRNACLERKRRAVQVSLDTLAQVEGDELVARAPAIAANLPAIDDCWDPERLAQIDPLPEAGPLRDAILHGYDVLARASTLAAAGALDEARAHADEFAAVYADALRHDPLRLEFDAFPARLDLLRERTASGIPELVAVAREAEARRLDDLAATLLVEAAEAASGHWSKPELERWLIDDAEAALRRLDRPLDPRAVSLRIAKGHASAQAGRLDEALTMHEEARTLALDLGDEARAEALTLDVAARLADLGRFDDAGAMLEAGRDAAQRRWGAGAPMVARFDFDLALLALDTGRFDDARTLLDRAEAIVLAAFGPDSLTGARIAFARVKLDLIEGEFEAGLGRLDRVLAVYSRELGPDHELLGDLHEARGVLQFFRGDLAGSLDSYAAALRIRTAVLGPEHPLVARLHSNIGESQLALGRIAEARASFERASSLYVLTLSEDHPDLALPLKGLGQIALAEGRTDDAVADLERALAIQLAANAEPLEIADLRASLARAIAQRDGRTRK